MRCGDCNKFVGIEEQDPEVDLGEVEQGSVDVSVRIANACAECGTELRESTFEMEAVCPESDRVAHAEHAKQTGDGDGDEDKHQLEAEVSAEERTTRRGKGARGRTYYGAEVEVMFHCACGLPFGVVQVSDEIGASEMDEC